MSIINYQLPKAPFIGKEKDNESLLGDLGVRKFDDGIGRFTSIDPLWEKYYSVSPYAYSANNPVMLMDPSGLAKYYDENGTQYDDGDESTSDETYSVHSSFLNDPEALKRKSEENCEAEYWSWMRLNGYKWPNKASRHSIYNNIYKPSGNNRTECAGVVGYTGINDDQEFFFGGCNTDQSPNCSDEMSKA